MQPFPHAAGEGKTSGRSLLCLSTSLSLHGNQTFEH